MTKALPPLLLAYAASPVAKVDIQEIIMEADKNCDGKLDRKEFYNIMKRKDDFYDFDDDDEEDDMNLRMGEEQYAGM